MTYELHISTVHHHFRRHMMMCIITDSNDPKCKNCGSRENLHIHHVDGDGESYQESGSSHIYTIRDEYLEGVEFTVVCKSCHKQIHDVPEGKEYRGR